MAITYSRFFKVKHRDFLQKGVYNAFLDQDSLLHIDPLLLKGSEIPEFTNAYTEFFNYFRLFIPLVKASKADNLQDRFFKNMTNRFTFKEIPNTGLGFSKGNTRGRGISGADTYLYSSLGKHKQLINRPKYHFAKMLCN